MRARLARVSTSAVSGVVNQTVPVRPERLNRVREAHYGPAPLPGGVSSIASLPAAAEGTVSTDDVQAGYAAARAT
jgi:hypothetical protein